MKKLKNLTPKKYIDLQNSNYAGALLILLIISIAHYFQIITNASVHDIYRRLYYIPILISASRKGIKGGALFAFISTIVYMPHFIVLNQYEINTYINIMLEIVMFYFLGILVGYYADRQNKNQLILREQIEQLEALENETRALIETVPVAVLSTNYTLEINKFNDLASHIFGLTKSNYKLEDKLSDMGITKQTINQLLYGDLDHYDKEVYLEDDFNIKAYACSLVSRFNNKGQKIGIVIVLSDITKIIEIEKQLSQSDKLSSLGLMASGVAHEIRNPLAIIRAIVQQINSEHVLKETEGFEIILEEIDRVNKLIQEMLTYAKPDASIIQEFDLCEIIDYVAHFSKNYALHQNVEIIVESNEHCLIKADKSKIIQALINIIINGIQAISDEGQIEIKSDIYETHVNIKIHDNGCGISDAQLKRLFDPFFSTKDTGTGLGLSTAQSIIHEHGGKIKVKSQLGHGTLFVIELPR